MAKKKVFETPEEKMEREARLEFMRNQTIEVELQARYWKAMYDTKYWTLEDNKLKESYEAYFQDVQTRAQDAADHLAKLQELGGLQVESEGEVTTVPSDIDLV